MATPRYLASLLIADGADVKVVQARVRHASAKTTLDTYSHLWPDADESIRATVGAVVAARMDSSTDVTAASVRLEEGLDDVPQVRGLFELRRRSSAAAPGLTCGNV